MKTYTSNGIDINQTTIWYTSELVLTSCQLEFRVGGLLFMCSPVIQITDGFIWVYPLHLGSIPSGLMRAAANKGTNNNAHTFFSRRQGNTLLGSS